MATPGDLLRCYASERSEAAFSSFVREHLNIVYFTALRRTGDAHAAEDVTQAVFTAVARQAEALVAHPNLTGWLYTTTRNLAEKTRRSEHRRKSREQDAFVMQKLSTTSPSASWERVKPYIDHALDQLNSGEREAVLLRYFGNRPYSEIGSLLGSSEDAARMRVDRALVKLHATLTRLGLKSTQSALALALGHQAALAAPAWLGVKVAGAAVTASTLTASTTVAIATAAGTTVLMTTAKTVTLVAAASIVAALSITGLLHERQRTKQFETALATLSKDRDYIENKVEELSLMMSEGRKREAATVSQVAAAPKPAAAAAPASPVEEPPIPGVTRKAPQGWWKNGSKAEHYTVGTDQNQTFRGKPSAYVQATQSNDDQFGGMMQTISGETFLGKRVRMSGWMKTEEVTKSGNLWVRVDGETRSGVQFDNMHDRAPKGTTDWKEYSIVLDVPTNAKSLSYGFFLGGNGKVWVSDTKIEPVGPEVPSTNLTKPPPTLPAQPVNLGFGNP